LSTFAIVAASGPDVGIGHLRRASRLEAAFEPVPGISVSLFSLTATEFRPSMLDHVGCDVLVLDLPPLLQTTELTTSLERLRSEGIKVVGIDGPSAGIDLLVVPSFHVSAEVEEEAHRQGAKVSSGWDRLIIDPRTAVAPRVLDAPVLVLTGGSDAAQLGQHLPASIDARLPEGTAIDWVVGPLAAPPRFPADPRLRWTVHRDVADLRPLMYASGHALAVYGVSVLELLHHGIPTVVLSPYGDRDSEHIAILEGEGLAVTETDPVRAVDELRSLLADPDRSATIACRAADRVPRPGTDQVVRDILELIQ
jgi:spore coat polysaccharide biosynthesis predicted glycosyltransferase SpsG